jgi:hypothetical protein
MSRPTIFSEDTICRDMSITLRAIYLRNVDGMLRDSARFGSMNDDKSPLLDLISCMICHQTMKLEKIDPDDEGNDLIQYRCKLCGRIERLRLFRRSRE